jgi:hypothetical protein
VFLEETDSCSYIFEWKTIYACQNPIPPAGMRKCDAISSSFTQYDLSPLTMTKQNWKAEFPLADGSSYVFELNVCAPLVNTNTITGVCANSSTGACQTKPADKSFLQKSLGAPAPVTFTSDGDLVLNYYMVCMH